MEGSCLALWRLYYFSVQFRRGRLVELHRFLQATRSNGVEKAQRTHGIYLCRVLAQLKGHLDMALGGQIVDLTRLDELNQLYKISTVRYITVVQLQSIVRVQVANPARVEGTRPSNNSVHLVVLGQEQFGQVGTILWKLYEQLGDFELNPFPTCPVMPLIRATFRPIIGVVSGWRT